jgi:hypothetical protein
MEELKLKRKRGRPWVKALSTDKILPFGAHYLKSAGPSKTPEPSKGNATKKTKRPSPG